MPKGYKLEQKPTMTCITCGLVKKMRDNYMARVQKYCSQKCKRYSIEVREKISRNRKGIYGHSKEQRQELSQRMTGNKFALEHKLSKEHKQAIREAHLGKKSHFYKDGRCDDPKYISWISNRHGVRKRRAEGNHTHIEWEKVKKEYNFTCQHCSKREPEIKLTEDHIIPLSKGGSDNIENIQPLCKSCNCKKHNKLPIKSK